MSMLFQDRGKFCSHTGMYEHDHCFHVFYYKKNDLGIALFYD